MKKVQFYMIILGALLLPLQLFAGEGGATGESPAPLPVESKTGEQLPAMAQAPAGWELLRSAQKGEASLHGYSGARTVGQELLRAVQNENTQLYSGWMQYALKSFTIEEFLSLMASRTSQEGDSLFHLMARAQNPQSRQFFAKEAKSFADLFRLRFRSGRVLGGEPIIIPSFKKTALGKAVRYNEQFPGKGRLGIIDEMRRLQTAPIKQMIQNLIGQTQGLIALRNLFYWRHSLANILGEYAGVRDPRIYEIDRLANYRELPDRFKSKTFFSLNHRGETPLETAIQSGNLQVWRVLKKVKTEAQADSDAMGAVGTGLIASVATLVPLLIMTFSYPETVHNMLLGAAHLFDISERTAVNFWFGSPFATGLTVGAARYKCRDVIQRFKILRRANNRPQLELAVP